MSSLRRILVAGLPAAGLTVAASLALAGSPAAAIEGHAARPIAMATPCADADRDKCDYAKPSDTGTAPTGTAPAGTAPAGTPAGTTPAGTAPTGATEPTGPVRGQGGYGGEGPVTTKPTPGKTTSTPGKTTSTPGKPTPGTTTPTANVDTVPPGVLGTNAPSPTPSMSGGVSAGHALPVTGAPVSAIVTLGGLMVAGGAASIWYTRRRRTV